jgi:hypothetical protein
MNGFLYRIYKTGLETRLRFRGLRVERVRRHAAHRVSAPINEDGAGQEPGDVPGVSLARAGRSAPVAGQGQPGRQLPALRSAGRRPRTEQHGMSVYRRIPLQFIFQTLRIGLHPYLLGGGHSGALD